MTVEWLLRALAAGALLALAALVAERVAGWLGCPRRGIWIAAMAGSLLLPLAALAAPALLPDFRLRAAATPRPAPPSEAPLAAPPAAEVEAGVAPASVAPPGTLPRGAGVVWLAASLSLLGALVWTQWRLGALCGGAVSRRVDGAHVRVSDRAGPLVLGLLHPEVVIPRWLLDAPPAERRLVVRHEEEHLRAGDPWLLALGALAVAALPWSPALWWQHRRLRLAVEVDCDARVLARGADRRVYGHALLRAVRRPRLPAPLALAWGGSISHLERRIVAMTTRTPSHRLLRAVPAAALAAGVALAACDVATDAPASSTSSTTGPRAGVVADDESAYWEGPDSLGLVVQRRPPPDPSRPYLGFDRMYVRERPVAVRDGERVPVAVQRFPLVAEVEPGSPAERAGLRPGDLILAINGRESREPPAVALRPGDVVDMRVRRGGRELDLRMVATSPPLEEWPPAEESFERSYRQWQEANRIAAELYPEAPR